MKLKALGLALAVASATSVNAADLYSKDGVSVSLSDTVEIQLVQAAAEGSDLEFAYDLPTLAGEATYGAAFGGVEYDLTSGATDAAYLGYDFGGAKLTVGNTDLPADNFGSDASIEGNSSAFSAFAADASDKQVQLATEFGPVSLAIATEIEGDLDVDVFASTSVGSVDLGLGYQDIAGEDTVGLTASTSFGPVGLGLDYSTNDSTTVTHLSATYSMFGFGYDIAEADGEDTNSYYVNATKSLSDNASVFAEVDGTEDDNGFLVGYALAL